MCRIDKPGYSFFDIAEWKWNGVGPELQGLCYEDAFALLGDVIEDLGKEVKNPAEG